MSGFPGKPPGWILTSFSPTSDEWSFGRVGHLVLWSNVTDGPTNLGLIDAPKPLPIRGHRPHGERQEKEVSHGFF